MPLPVVTYAYASLLDTPIPSVRVRRVVEGKKTCAFCEEVYEPQPHERPERACCMRPQCETAWELAKDHRRHRTPRPALENAPPRPLRTGNS